MRSGSPAEAVGAPSRLRALVVSLRTEQWLKSGALVVAPLFARRLGDPASLPRLALGIAAFCLLSSAVYLANDITDRERDRHHPEKRLRPVAAGEVALQLAALTAAVLGLAGLGLASLVGRRFLAVAAAYLLVQVLYTVALKTTVVLDVFAIATGFVLRVVAGAEAVAVPVSNWLYLCALLLSLFLALAKRRAELMLLAGGASHHRPILAEYSAPLLEQLITVLSACTVLAYALYTLSPETIEKFGSDRLKFTIPFVLFGLFRYLYLVHRQGGGGQPERVLLRDRPTQLNLLAYLAAVGWAIHR